MKAIALLAPAAALLLAACQAGTPDRAAESDASDMSHPEHEMGKSTPAALTEAQAAYKAANDEMHAGMADIPADPDVAFMKGMLAHHRGAVAMSEVALKYARDEQARNLAARVIAAQSEEIAEMEAWLAARGAP